jgi:hypothetical protein
MFAGRYQLRFERHVSLPDIDTCERSSLYPNPYGKADLRNGDGVQDVHAGKKASKRSTLHARLRRASAALSRQGSTLEQMQG